MTTAITGIDHVVIAVDDLDHAANTYRRLGFILSPRALHSATMGTANHTIMLEHDYFELLAVVAPTERNQRWREVLAYGQGLVGIAAATPDASAVRDAWRSAGFAPGEVVGFARQVERPGGATAEARFETVSLPKDNLAGPSLFACAQLTREAVWLPELMVHPNSAVALRKVTVSVPDPRPTSAAWQRAFPGSSVTEIAGGMRIRVPNHRIDLLEPKAAAQLYPRAFIERGTARSIALELAVSSLDACLAAVASGGIPFQTERAGVVIAADQACGVALAMVPVGTPVD
jgi:hypothetical protein